MRRRLVGVSQGIVLITVRTAVWGMVAAHRLQDHKGSSASERGESQLAKDVAQYKDESEKVSSAAWSLLMNRRTFGRCLRLRRNQSACGARMLHSRLLYNYTL